MKNLVIYVPKRYYMDRVLDILENFQDYKAHIISLENLSLSQKNMTFFNAKGVISLLIHLIKLRKTTFDVLLGCNVDNMYFQLMIKLLKFDEFHTFDEGIILLRDSKWQPGTLDGIYYIREFDTQYQKRWFYLNKIIGIPIPWGLVFQLSHKHYTFFDPDKTSHPLSKTREVTYVKRKETARKLERIFLGVNSYWGWTDDYSKRGNKKLYQESLLRAADRLNSLNLNIYLMHPRENDDLIKLLSPKTIILKNLDGNEIFLNSLSKDSQLTVYTVMSGAVYDLDTKIKIRYVNLFDRFKQEPYTLWINQFNQFRKSVDPDCDEAFEVKF